MTDFITILGLLIFAHMLADYPLQGAFLAQAKNPFKPFPGTPWWQAMAAHGIIHGGFVGIITGSIWLGVAETVIHCIIDYDKCRGHLTYNEDQAGHLGCKVLWAVLALPNTPLFGWSM